MKALKVLGCVAGGIAAALAAPIVLPVVAASAVGAAVTGAAAAALTAVGSAAAVAGAAVAGTAVGSAVVGAASAVGGVAAAAGTAVASTAVGSAVASAAGAAGAAVAGVTGGSAGLAVATGVAVTGTAFGATRGAQARGNFAKAKQIGREAEAKHKKAVARFDRATKATSSALDSLGEQKLTAYSDTVRRFLELYKYVAMAKGKNRRLPNTTLPGAQQIASMEATSAKAGEIASAGLTALQTGTLTSYGALGLAEISAASTGGIRALNGAAAANASLAWLSGGALSAGGGGMALATATLGGVFVGPALAITGFAAAGSAEKRLTVAEEYAAEVDTSIAEIDACIKGLKAIARRVDEIASVVKRLSVRGDKLLDRFEAVVRSHNGGRLGTVSLDELPDGDATVIMMAVNVITQLGKTLDTHVIDTDGKVTDDSRVVVNKAQLVLEATA